MQDFCSVMEKNVCFLKTSGFQPGSGGPHRGCEPYVEGSPEDIFMYIAVLHLFYPSLDGGRWVGVGCYNGARYEKR